MSPYAENDRSASQETMDALTADANSFAVQDPTLMPSSNGWTISEKCQNLHQIGVKTSNAAK